MNYILFVFATLLSLAASSSVSSPSETEKILSEKGIKFYYSPQDGVYLIHREDSGAVINQWAARLQKEFCDTIVIYDPGRSGRAEYAKGPTAGLLFIDMHDVLSPLKSTNLIHESLHAGIDCRLRSGQESMWSGYLMDPVNQDLGIIAYPGFFAIDELAAFILNFTQGLKSLAGEDQTKVHDQVESLYYDSLTFYQGVQSVLNHTIAAMENVEHMADDLKLRHRYEGKYVLNGPSIKEPITIDVDKLSHSEGYEISFALPSKGTAKLHLSVIEPQASLIKAWRTGPWSAAQAQYMQRVEGQLVKIYMQAKAYEELSSQFFDLFTRLKDKKVSLSEAQKKIDSLAKEALPAEIQSLIEKLKF